MSSDVLEDSAPFNPPTSAFVSAGVILVYDYLCTLDYEVKYVWAYASWSNLFGTALFVLNRYLPFVDILMSIHVSLSVPTGAQCRSTYSVVAWLTLFGVLIAEAILFLRTFAIWNRTKRMGIALSCLFVGNLIPGIIIMKIQVDSLVYEPALVIGCKLVEASIIVFGLYLMLAFTEVVIVILTIIKAYTHLRHSRVGWVTQLYRDGVLFFIYIFTASLVNILLPIAARGRFANMLAGHLRVLHSVLCTRVLFLILRRRSRSSLSPPSSPYNDVPPDTTQHRLDNGTSGIFSTIIDDDPSNPFPPNSPTESYLMTSPDYRRTDRHADPPTELQTFTPTTIDHPIHEEDRVTVTSPSVITPLSPVHKPHQPQHQYIQI